MTYFASQLTTQQAFATGAAPQRRVFLTLNPFCMASDCDELSTDVDYILPPHSSARPFWDESNWQALCARHHNQNTEVTG